MKRLEELRVLIEEETISSEEITELEQLTLDGAIENDDLLLLLWASVPHKLEYFDEYLPELTKEEVLELRQLKKYIGGEYENLLRYIEDLEKIIKKKGMNFTEKDMMRIFYGEVDDIEVEEVEIEY